MTTAVIYARVSTARQAEDGLPIKGQIERCHAKAAALSAEVLDVFVDSGLSGRDFDRPAFQAALAFCREHRPAYLITWSTSRFARDQVHAAIARRDLAKAGTRVVYVSVDLDSNTDSGWMVESILSVMDEHYSRQVRADTLRSMAKNAADGFWNGGRPPFGYRAVAAGKRRRLELVDAEAAVVREIFDRAAGGQGATLIARALNADGIQRRGRPWSKGGLVAMLISPVYIGQTVFNRRDRGGQRDRPESEWIVRQSHEPCVDRRVWEAVQDLVGARATGGTGHALSTHAFTGLLRCVRCGAAMQAESGTGRGRKLYYYYQCRAARRGGLCGGQRLPAPAVDEWLLRALLDDLFTAERVAELVREVQAAALREERGKARRRRQLDARKTDVAARYRSLCSVLELQGQAAPNMADLAMRLRELRAELLDIDRALAATDPLNITPAKLSAEEAVAVTNGLRAMIAGDRDMRRVRAFLQPIVASVVIGESYATVEYRPENLIDAGCRVLVRPEIGWLPVRSQVRTAILRIALPSTGLHPRAAA